MKKTLLILLLLSITANAQDIRSARVKAQTDREKAVTENLQAEQEITSSKASLNAEVEKLESMKSKLEAELSQLEKSYRALSIDREKLSKEWSKQEMEFKEISGNVRLAARDLETMMHQSPLTVGHPERLSTISPLLDKGYFPDIDDINQMVNVYLDEIVRSGEVALRSGEIIGRDGLQTEATILSLGPFTSIYQTENETGFLKHSTKSQELTALSELPSGKSLQNYLSGKSESVTIDLSGGSALRQITQKTSIMDQLRDGGPIVWPILIIALLALGIVVERLIFLQKVHGNTDRLMSEVSQLAVNSQWDECNSIVQQNSNKGWPVVRVLRAGLASRKENRETLESVLQESILRELPRLERGLSALAIFGAVAPLLGLLGTVTGMIDTFRVITLYGTGDPKLMSGGISEALVTTEIGLAVAIPVMLLHTLLSRRVDHLVGDMEEKAIALSNAILKRRD
jgi:biopolymer transport protein ExbB